LTESTHGDSALQQRYDTVLKHSTLREMWKPLYASVQDGSDVDEDSVGLSFFLVRRGHTTFVGHTGNQAGFRAFIFLNPDTGAAVAAAFNTDSDLPAKEHPSTYQRIRDGALQLIE
jgi:CubicO group peptidase (beta-lactamase class C family)